MAEGKPYYYCFVPGCKSTTITNPEKIFFSVPFEKKERAKWISKTRRDMKKSPISSRTHARCCQDHFDMEQDMENYLRWKTYKEMGFSCQAILKPGVVPHKFLCQADSSLELPPQRRSVIDKLNQRKTIQDAMATTSDNLDVVELEGSSAGPECLVPPVPFEEIPPVEPQELFSTKSTQTPKTLMKPPSRSVRVQTEKVKRLLSDAETQMTPTKRACLEEPVPATSSSSSSSTKSTVSAGGSVYTVTSSAETSSEASHDEEKDSLKKLMGEAAIKIISSNPKFYIGITPGSYKFVETMETLLQVPKRDILLTLKKLRLNQPFTSLGDDFGISHSTASRIFSSTIMKLAADMRSFMYMPDRKSIAQNMPITFRRRYSKVKSVIDCFEVKIEKPSKPFQQSLTWSEYKKANTVKYLVSCTPHGFITYISEGYCGRTTDTNLTKDCGFLSTLRRGDHVMADRGFKGLEPILREKGITLVRPPSVYSGERLSRELAREAKRIASLRIHVERLIGRLRVFHFIAADAVDTKLIRSLNSAVIVICALCNLQSPLLQ